MSLKAEEGSMSLKVEESAAPSLVRRKRNGASSPLRKRVFVETGHRTAAPKRQSGPLTAGIILSKCTEKRKSTESDQGVLRRLTTLSLQAADLDCMEAVSNCPGLQTLYLYSNDISQVAGLQQLQSLSILHLEDNALVDMSPIKQLPSLRQLHLERNRISEISGLTGCRYLEELHLADMKLQPGLSLQFDPAAIAAVGGSLRKLNVAGNNIEYIQALGGLQRLTDLDISGGNLASVAALKEMLSGMVHLSLLECKDNSVCRNRRFRQTVIAQAPRISELNGQEITDNEKKATVARLQMHGDRHTAESVPPRRAAARRPRPAGGAGGCGVAMQGCGVGSKSMDRAEGVSQPVGLASNVVSGELDLSSMSLEELQGLMSQIKGGSGAGDQASCGGTQASAMSNVGEPYMSNAAPSKSTDYVRKYNKW